MPSRLVECVPNFSEGRDPAKVDAIEYAIRSAGAAVLDRTSDHDHHRSVITFAGPPEIAAEAAFRAVRQAVYSIDLREHSGVHPRIGAADVVPFVPLSGVTLEDCARLAVETGRRIWEELQVPVYLYEAAARRPESRNLADVRRGRSAPDFGGPDHHASSGAVIVGARKFLIAFNVNLESSDVTIARQIARAVRFSSGGLPYVKAVGVMLASRNLAQVSMNLTDFEQTPIHVAFEAVRREAERHGVGIAGTEIIGLVPKKAVEMAAAAGFRDENLNAGVVLENRLAEEFADTAGG
ncbi:MAG TPA: glutamate formimidoyltransferase [Bryobacteraceae bacterium]|jgi:glutamate formiminotransferase|nr:glutamate formimidoyltransferase [Bryobacteraceae bacterium]